ncbi:MAG: hypothetical protein HYW71_01790 [Candidatus Niyogibacteria bacterium]|nr:hypothetical protein [Candidatus Niyogibacteria bacterium]
MNNLHFKFLSLLLIISVLFIVVPHRTEAGGAVVLVTPYIPYIVSGITTAVTGSDYFGCSINVVWGCDSSSSGSGGSATGLGGTPSKFQAGLAMPMTTINLLTSIFTKTDPQAAEPALPAA